MRFNLKLFVLVGVFVGLRDVLGGEKVKNEDDGFIVAELKNNDELKDAMDHSRVIIAVYKTEKAGDVPIIHEDFKGQLSSILVWNGKNVEKVEVENLHRQTGNLYYNIPDKGEYTVYFIFKQECFTGTADELLNSTSLMFSWCKCLIRADFWYFDTKNVKDMSYMFSNCTALSKLNLSNFDTQKVTNMSFMFHKCYALTGLDLSKFDTKNVTDMSWMFNDCTALKDLDLSKFNTKKVTNMSSMFNECSALTKLDLSKFDTTKVTNMSNMFAECTSLKQVSLPSKDAERKKRCICCGDEYVCWNNHEVVGLDPDITTFKAPNKINLMIPTGN
jgi:surface protein